MTEQGYNYLDRSNQEMSGFFEIRIENLETPAPPLPVKSLTRIKKNSKKRKAVSLEDSDKDSSDDEKPPSKNKSCQYHGKYSHSTNEYPTLKALFEKNKSSKSKGFRKGGEKTYTKHEVNVLIEKKLKKAFKRKKKLKQDLRTFEEMEVSGSEESNQSLDDSDVFSKSDDS